ncbi:MAG: YhcH/YjgK/YiaL family protein [Clostridia bacterium]|nr:YhcH/YjgK/YiaL family protein [Clostridia bacterium]
MFKAKKINELKSVVNIPEEALAFLKEATKDTPNGKYYFGETCYVNVMDCTTKSVKFDENGNAIMEAHDKYIDAQFIIDGEEKILFGSRENMPVYKEYNPEKDVLFYSVTPYDEVTYKTGETIVLPPEDAHQPGCCVAEPKTIKKAVVKIKA